MATPNNQQNPLNIINLRNDITTLITATDIKVYSAISANIQDTNFKPSIIVAQDLKVKPILGETLFDKLLEEYINAGANPNNLPVSGVTDGVNYQELYQKVYKVLIFWALSDSIFPLGMKLEEKGLMLNNSDYSENGGVSAMREIEGRTRKTAEYYTEELVCYIKNTFKDDDVVKDESKSEGTFFSGIYYPSRNKSNCGSCKKFNGLF